MSVFPRVRQGLALAAGLIAAGAALAAAPMVKTQAPGYYRVMLGDFELTVLNDGTFHLPLAKLLGNTTPAKVEEALARSFLKDPVETSDNAFLVNTGSKLVLVDTGAGNLFGPGTGFLVANLRAAGYQPEQIDEIYITHMHGDHIGGLMSGDKPTFPNAIVRADQAESDYWLSTAHRDAAPEAARDSFDHAIAALKAYQAAGRFKPFSGDTELVPGVRAHPSHGHTAGHTTYLVESKGEKLALWGDLMHAAAVQFPEPAVVMSFDSDTKAALAEREKAFAEAARQGYWVGATHLAFPALGHLRSAASGYTFVPANYTTLR